MANLPIPITFHIYKGDQLVREETLNEPVIKIGKLASSHLRLEDETVSRMHAVVEVTGPGEVQLIDLGSTRGTTVNGARINKAVLKSGDQVQFGDSRVVVTFGAAAADADATPQPVAVPQQPVQPSPQFAPPVAYAPQQPAPAQFAPPAQPIAQTQPFVAVAQTQQFTAPPQQYAPAPQQVAPAPAVQADYGASSFSAPSGHSAAEIELMDGSKAIEIQSLYHGVVINTRHLLDATGKSSVGQSKAFIGAGIAAVLIALLTFFITIVNGGREKDVIGGFVIFLSIERRFSERSL